MLRGSILILAFALSAAASLTCIKAPSLTAWKVAILVDEFGYWLWPVPLMLAAVALTPAYSGSNAEWWRTLTWLVCLLSLGLLLKPMLQAAGLARQLPQELTREFGPVAIRRTPFSISALFIGSGDQQSVHRETREFKKPAGDNALSLDFYYAVGPRPAPCVLIIHGGGWDSGDRHQFDAFNVQLARSGFAVAAIDYRLAPRHRWPAQREDTLDALAYLKVHHAELGVDPAQFVLLGRSAGGQIAEAVAYDQPPDCIRGVIALYAPADLYFAWKYTKENDLLNSFLLMRQYLGGSPEEVAGVFDAASAYRYVRPGTVPTLLGHGQLDALVWHRQSERLAARLKEVNTPVVFLDLPWATHAFDYNLKGPSGQITAFAIEWFLRSVTRPAAPHPLP